VVFRRAKLKITIEERLVEGQAWSECKQQPPAFLVLVVVEFGQGG